MAGILTHTTETKQAEDSQCILCGRCLEVCPLFAASGSEELSPRGKLFLLRRLSEHPDELAESSARRLASLCLTCGRCADVCPQGMDVPSVVARLRGEHPGFKGWLWRAWVEGAPLLWPAAAHVGAALGLDKGVPARMGAMADAPRLTPWWKAQSFQTCSCGPKAVLFSGCLAKHCRTSWTAKARTLLQGLGLEVLGDDAFSCCGSPLAHAGQARRARDMARANIDAWRAADRPMLVSFCATCTGTLRGYARDPELGLDDAEAKAWESAVTPLAALLKDDVTFVARQGPEAVRYHRPCHSRHGDADLEFLQTLPGPDIDSGDGRDCCGMGGVLQLGAPKLSERVGNSLFEKRGISVGEILLSGCSGCIMQLTATAPKGVLVGHWLDAII